MSADLNFQESLPRKRMGAGCLIFNEGGRLLLLKPKYKPVWEIPGGITEQNESPKVCCQREVEEEIGLEREIGKLLVVDYNSRTEEKTESLMFIFYGGVISKTDIARIRVQSSEISEYGFFARETLPMEMSVSLKNRILAAWERISDRCSGYLENQKPV